MYFTLKTASDCEMPSDHPVLSSPSWILTEQHYFDKYFMTHQKYCFKMNEIISNYGINQKKTVNWGEKKFDKLCVEN